MLHFQFEATKFEESWSRKALETFYEEGWIDEVLYLVKCGKEATVYCCKADPATGYDLVAAKIYRHRGLRSVKNYQSYREGRHITTDKRKLRPSRTTPGSGSNRQIQPGSNRSSRSCRHSSRRAPTCPNRLPTDRIRC